MRSMKSQQQQGSVLILFAVTLVVLMGFVGLALDSGSGYLAQAKLSSAVDGAALAGMPLLPSTVFSTPTTRTTVSA
jgi:Flp pilus assembly protein TadG